MRLQCILTMFVIIFAVLVIFLFITFAYIDNKIDKIEKEIKRLKNKGENDFLIITLSIAKLDSRVKEIEKYKDKEDL